METLARKKILIVGTHFDDTRLPVRRMNKLPQGMGTAFLAGAFNPSTCEVKCWSETASGPLTDPALLGWPDMIVLTGVSVCFDRMLHVSAMAKTLNPRVIIAAGGPPVRILKKYSENFFDYVCLGDVEQLADVAREALGPRYAAAQVLPRMDLAYWIKRHGHIETSRNCNFACTFCSLTGEGAKYGKYEFDYIREQFERVRATGKKWTIHFIDNNFYGNDREYFFKRLDVIDEYRRKGYFKYWSALLTGDFYLSEENLQRAADTGCVGLFTGVESFDPKSLKAYNKHQNMKLPQVDLMRRSLNRGIAVFYGLFADVYNRSLKDIHEEIDFIVGNDELMLPSFVTLPIPLIGTPMFSGYLREKRFFPKTKLRDLDGTTLCMEPRDSMDSVVKFLGEFQDLIGYRKKVMKHGLGFYRRYRKVLNWERMAFCLAPNFLLTVNRLATGDWFGAGSSKIKRTHISSTDPLDECYTPSIRIDSRYENWFKPTMLTDARGELNADLAEDLSPADTKVEAAAGV